MDIIWFNSFTTDLRELRLRTTESQGSAPPIGEVVPHPGSHCTMYRSPAGSGFQSYPGSSMYLDKLWNLSEPQCIHL